MLSFSAPTCMSHPGAILVHDYWAIYDPPPFSLLYFEHYMILVITISYKGQSSMYVSGSGWGLTLNPELGLTRLTRLFLASG